ncbi:MAG: trypsin-like serine protease [Sandaracinus sp.]|nr:trypsin-like serine protease [Sandaracinus sp.]
MLDRSLRLVVLCGALGSVAHAQDVGSVSQPAILGNDDRQQWFEAGSMQGVVQQSTVMLVPAASVSSGTEVRTRLTYSARVDGLCTDEAFACEESLGSCSGTLIDGHTVVTAGHCFSSLASIRAGGSCNGTAVVFNWRMESGGNRAQVLRSRDVYYCHEVLAAHYQPGTLEPDFAIFTIKRTRNGTAPTPVSGPYRPAAISTTRRSSGTIFTVGHPAGIPVKVSPGTLYPGDSMRFGSNADLFPGNSGGGTFAGSTLIGVATNAPDGSPTPGSRNFYPVDAAAGCRRASRVLSGRNSHMWLAPMIQALCDPTHPHHLVTRPTVLCGTAPAVPPSSGGGTTTPSPTFPSTVECNAGDGDPSSALFFLLALVLLSRRRRQADFVGLMLAVAVACAGDPQPTENDASVETDAATDAPLDRRWATAVVLPDSTRRTVGFDLDGDGDVDNAFGHLATSLADVGFDLTTLINDTLALGDAAWLARFTTRGDRGTLTLREGVADGPPSFTGEGDHFAVSDAAPTRLEGTWAPNDAFAFEAEGDSLELAFPLGEARVALPLTHVRVEAELPIDEAVLHVGGALAERELVAFVDSVAASFTARVAATAGCPEACEDETIAALLGAVDGDEDGVVSGAELRTHALLGPLLAPDVDLDGDGRDDHFSFGLLAFLRTASFDEVSSSSSALVAKADLCAVSCEASDCRSCQSTACGWCDGQGCLPRSRARECEAESWIDSQLYCPSCEHTSETACNRDGFCGWSATCGRCVNDTRCSQIPAECSDLRQARGC